MKKFLIFLSSVLLFLHGCGMFCFLPYGSFGCLPECGYIRETNIVGWQPDNTHIIFSYGNGEGKYFYSLNTETKKLTKLFDFDQIPLVKEEQAKGEVFRGLALDPHIQEIHVISYTLPEVKSPPSNQFTTEYRPEAFYTLSLDGKLEKILDKDMGLREMRDPSFSPNKEYLLLSFIDSKSQLGLHQEVIRVKDKQRMVPTMEDNGEGFYYWVKSEIFLIFFGTSYLNNKKIIASLGVGEFNNRNGLITQVNKFEELVNKEQLDLLAVGFPKIRYQVKDASQRFTITQVATG